MCYVSASPDQRTTTDLVFLRRSNDDGPDHDRHCKRWNINGQHTNHSKTTDFEHGPSQAINEAGAIDHLRLENQLTELKSLVRQLAVSQH
ncbi:hypothetical protein CR513_13905, partial [Mucuna pruriens]